MTDDALVPERYEVIQTISSGDRGSLRKARDRDLDKLVALKTLVLRDEDVLEDFRSETRILHALQHPNLPTVRHDFVLGDGSYMMVIDWVDGVDLEEKLSESGRPGLVLPSVIDWVGQIAGAIDYLHSYDPPIVHGDVKPSNIVLARTNRAVLLDFGIARRAGQLSNAGTRGYMISPEWPDRHGVAIQAARARYTARGFQAAALTALGTVGSSWDPPPTPIPVRHAQLRFDRPYAVLAFAVPDDGYYPTKDSLWDAVPVFSAWVAEPSEASD